ncbi:Leucine carboxyl methyltransferase 1 [Exaiptasia diaphana]|nr:Leucine carboxyl methyltransferase 1 [Exaiptasia diaphana]
MSQTQDEAVIATNNDATNCKRFAVHVGYWQDKYIQFFAKLGERKAPEINRGYYARTKGISYLLEQFLEMTESNCQVISLGAGFDTLFWQLKEKDIAPKVFVEIDLNAVVDRKCFCIKSRKQLQEVFKPEDNLQIGKREVHSTCYHLLAADLRDVSMIDLQLNSIALDRSLPTIFIAECVLVYMEPEKSSALLDWAGKNFTTAVFLNYEQGRNCNLLGALVCPDLQSQRNRFLASSWQAANALTMEDVYRYLPRTEIERLILLYFSFNNGFNDF